MTKKTERFAATIELHVWGEDAADAIEGVLKYCRIIKNQQLDHRLVGNEASLTELRMARHGDLNRPLVFSVNPTKDLEPD